MSRKVVFEFSAFEQFTDWSRLDKNVYRKIVELIKDINRLQSRERDDFKLLA